MLPWTPEFKLDVPVFERQVQQTIDKTFLWLADPRFSNRILPPYIGLSEDESRICRETFETEFKDIE